MCTLSIKHFEHIITGPLYRTEILNKTFDHVKHCMYAGLLQISSASISCRVGEGRACWSLGNAHTALGNHETALGFAQKHLEISKEVTYKYTKLLSTDNQSTSA